MAAKDAATTIDYQVEQFEQGQKAWELSLYQCLKRLSFLSLVTCVLS